MYCFTLLFDPFEVIRCSYGASLCILLSVVFLQSLSLCIKKKKIEGSSKTVSETQKSLIKSSNKTNSETSSDKKLKGSVGNEVQPNQERASSTMNYADELAIPEKKAANILEKIAAERDVILNPENVYFCGNLDDIAITRKSQTMKEVEEMTERKSESMTVGSPVMKRATLNEKACKLYEIHNEPTVEEVDSFSDLY